MICFTVAYLEFVHEISLTTSEGVQKTKLPQILLNGNNIAMVWHSFNFIICFYIRIMSSSFVFFIVILRLTQAKLLKGSQAKSVKDYLRISDDKQLYVAKKFSFFFVNINRWRKLSSSNSSSDLSSPPISPRLNLMIILTIVENQKTCRICKTDSITIKTYRRNSGPHMELSYRDA